MSQTNEKPSLPALDRGLHILDRLIRSVEPMRYNELRASLPGIQDSTLARILKALEQYGYVHRDPDRGYETTPKVREWSRYLGESRDLPTQAANEVERLVEYGGESAAAVLLEEGQLNTIASQSEREGIQVLKLGEILHFEPDHAAAIAILAELPAKERKLCLKGPTNRLPAEFSLPSTLKKMRQDNGILIDQSETRLGVSRIALVFRNREQLGAIFYCLTREACRAKKAKLFALLQKAAARLQS